MLYTAVKDHPCYAGYLWAPFDAVLNVPRLMQFPQDKIWYHSPFTDHYVPNPAVPADPKNHAPAAMVMKKTANEYMAEVEEWGPGWHGWWCVHVYLYASRKMTANYNAVFVGGGESHKTSVYTESNRSRS
jgi:hypothetical protein